MLNTSPAKPPAARPATKPRSKIDYTRRRRALARAARSLSLRADGEVFGLTMATVGNKTRIYDLAKELKLDNKKVIEDARREGIDVSVPSNTVPNEVAERIRAKYFPKKATPKVAPRLIKHAHMEAAPAEATAVEPSAEAPAYEAPPPAAPSVEPGRFEPRGPQVRVLKKAPVPTPLAPPTTQAVPPAAETFASTAPPTSEFEPAP